MKLNLKIIEKVRFSIINTSNNLGIQLFIVIFYSLIPEENEIYKQ